MKNVLFVISGPSGVGKGTIARKLIERNYNYSLSISCTTRNPRVGEKHAREYFFISHEEFQEKIKNGGFLEYSNHFDNYYGTPKDFVLDKLKTNDVLLEIDVNGGLSVKNSFKEAILIMILPPSLEEVRKRLIKRGTESLEKIESRISRMEFELQQKDKYDYCVVNDKLEDAVSEIEQIIATEKNK